MTKKELYLLALCACLSAPFAMAEPEPAGGGPAEDELVAYFACDAMAVRQVLDPGAARRCAAIFARIKMSFLPGIAVGPAMDPGDWAAAHRAGYAAFRDWVVAHPDRAAAARARAATLLEEGAPLPTGIAGNER